MTQPHAILSRRPRRSGAYRRSSWLLAALLIGLGSPLSLRAAEEFRAAWADVFHVGTGSAAEVDTMVSTLVSGRYNVVIVQVLGYMDRNGTASHGAHWKSSILPWSPRVTASFDPLAYLCTKAHAQGIQVHAWLGGSGGGPYRVSTVWPPPNNATLAAHPEWFIAPYANSEGGSPQLVDGNYSLDMGSPDVQEYLVSIVRELVTNYPIDGINWDDELNSTGYNEGFGYPAYSQANYARSGLARFRINTGYVGTPANTHTAWSNYRRRFKNELIARVQAEIQSIKTNPRQPLRHTIAPIAYSPVPGSCTFSGSAPYTYFCDWAGMLQNGYVDAAIPQTYSSSTFNTWVDRCVGCWQYNRQIFSGIGAYLYSNATIADEISYLRSKGLKGYSTYSYAVPTSGSGWWSYAAANVNTSTATVPTMPWRNPATATEGIVWGRVKDASTGLYVDDATVTVAGGPTVKTDGNGYYVATLVPATAGGTAHATTASKTGMTPQTVTAIALAGDVVRYDLNLNAATNVAPTIITQPQSLAVKQGGSATFTVAATGTAPLAYQWRRNGAGIAGATLSSYTKNNVQTSDAGSYSVVVTNLAGSATSSNATLTVIVPPTIITQPLSQTVTETANVTFTVAASGTAPFAYQWRFNGVNVAGATLSSYTKNNVQLADAGSYSAVVTNLAGSATSANAILTVQALPTPPAIITPPISQTANQGGSATFTVTASGSAPLAYQWRWFGTNLAGATGTSLTLANLATNQSGPYTVVVTNAYGAITSAVATLTVTPTLEVGGLAVLWNLAPGSRPYLTTTVGGPPDERGMAYNPLTRRVIVVQRSTTTAYVLDGDTGADLWTLNTTGVTGGYTSTYYLLMVGVAEDGVVYAGNMTLHGNTTSFKLYRWANDSAGTVPTVAYSGDPGAGQDLRWGDTLDVRGAGASTQIIIGSLNTSHFAVLTTANGTNFTSKLVTLTDAPGGAVGSGLAFGTGNTFWCKAGLPAPLNLRQASFDLAAGTATTVRNYADPAFPDSLGPIGVNPSLDLLGGVYAAAANGGNSFRLYHLVPTNSAPGFITSTNFATDNDNSYSGTGAVDFGGDRVYALSSNNGLLAMQLVPPAALIPPSIVTHPVSQTVNQGGSATFTVSATGSAPLAYQWRFNGTNIAGATGSSYTRANVQPADAGNYSVFVSNDAGNATSANAVLTVTVPASPPVISAGPQSQTVIAGQNATFTVTATGTAPLNYQWRFNGANLAGATASSYTRANVQVADAGAYTVVVSNSYGSVTGAVATLTVHFTLTTSVAAGGTVSKTPDQSSYAPGAPVTLTATPSAGYEFSGWSGDASGTNNPLTVVMGGNLVIAANFTVVCDLILDNTDPEVSYVGTWQTGTAAGKYGADYRFALGSAVGNSNVTYRPNICADGRYDVYLWYLQGANRATNAPWVISYSGGTTNIRVNQQINGSRWWRLASALPFTQGTAGFARLYNTNATGGTSGSTVVLADAVRFAYVGPLTTPTATTLSSSANPSVYGDAVTLTATVTGSGGTPSGLVTFKDGATVLGTAILNGSGQAVWTTTTLSASGSPHSLTAVYSGDSSFAASTSVALSQVVNPKALTVTGATVASKVYDGTTAATISGAALNGVVSGDAVALGNAASGTFANKHVGVGKAVSTAMTLSGADAGNYTLTQPALTGTITARALTVTGATVASKVYDGTTAATISGAVLNGVISGDAVALGNAASGTFANKHVGVGKAVSTAMTLSGADAGNYTLAQPALTGTITARALTVTGLAAQNKVYDGTTTATLTGTPGLVGAVSGDGVALAGTATGTFANADVGTAKTVTISGLSLAGADAGNYTLTPPTATADITGAATTTTLISSVNPVGVGSNVTFTATVVSGAGTPAGTVVFLAGGVPFHTNTLAGGVAAASTDALSPGTNTIRAEYAGGGNYLGSDGSLEQVVKAFLVCGQTNVLLGILNNQDGTFTLLLAGTPQADYYIVSSSDPLLPAANWMPLPGSTNTVTNAGGFWQFTVTNAFTQQFYRSVSVVPCP